MEYYFRGETMAYVKELCKRAEDCVKGACAASGCTYQMSVYECPYEDNIINYTLCDLLKEAYAEVGRTDVLPVDEVPSGSSDIGAVSYVCPSLHGYIKIADACVNGHSKEMADATISSQGKQALRDGGHRSGPRWLPAAERACACGKGKRGSGSDPEEVVTWK